MSLKLTNKFSNPDHEVKNAFFTKTTHVKKKSSVFDLFKLTVVLQAKRDILANLVMSSPGELKVSRSDGEIIVPS
jgi:hypothetical protein